MESFPEHTHQLPLNTSMDVDQKHNLYKWHTPSAVTANVTGARVNLETEDNLYHTAQRYPWISDRRPFHPIAEQTTPVTTTPPTNPGLLLNSDYSHLLSAYHPEEGFKKSAPTFASRWERLLSYHHGLYWPSMSSDALTADEIRIKTNQFAETLELDDPSDACRMLAVEEFKCLHTMQTFLDPQGASKSCVKWFNEWQQCKWDQEKLTKGYNYIEDRTARKHKPYIAAPDFPYS